MGDPSLRRKDGPGRDDAGGLPKMFLQEHIVITVWGIRLCHDSQAQESQAAEVTAAAGPGGTIDSSRIGTSHPTLSTSQIPALAKNARACLSEAEGTGDPPAAGPEGTIDSSPAFQRRVRRCNRT